MSITETPNSPSWMDKKCLELWLGGHYGDVTVTELHLADSAYGTGDNHLSDMRRMTVETKGGKSYPLIVKTVLEEGVVATVMRESAIFKKEKEMYGNTLPRIQALLQEALPGDFESVAPLGIHTCKSFLILEDLSPSGFEMMNRREGLDLKHCLSVLRTLARFHAASVILHQQDPGSMKHYQIGFFEEPAVVNNWHHFFSGMATTLADELGTWTEEWGRYADKLRTLSRTMLKKVEQQTAREDERFNVLNHGDVWTNNVLFRGQGDTAKLIDFQLAHFTSPARDLHYFLSTSANLDVITNHLDTVIQEYHRELCATLTALNYTGKVITLNEMREEFDRKSLFGLYCMISPYAAMQSDPALGFTFDDILSTGVNPGTKMYGEQFKKVVRHRLPIFESKGVFEYELP